MGSGGYLQEGVVAAGETLWTYAQGNHIVEEAEEAVPGNTAFPEEFQVGLHFINGYRYPAAALSVTFPELLNRERPVIGNSVLKLNPEQVAEHILTKNTKINY